MPETCDRDEWLPTYTVYGPGTSDHPGLYVVRRWVIADGKPTPDPELTGSGPTLDAARRSIPRGLTRLSRSPADDPNIVEVWL